MTRKELATDYPSLNNRAAKLICTMYNVTDGQGSIFYKLAEMISEYDEDNQSEICNCISVPLKEIYTKYLVKSLKDRNKENKYFRSHIFEMVSELCDKANINDKLASHIRNGFHTLLKYIERDRMIENKRFDFYYSNFVKYSRYFAE